MTHNLAKDKTFQRTIRMISAYQQDKEGVPIQEIAEDIGQSVTTTRKYIREIKLSRFEMV